MCLKNQLGSKAEQNICVFLHNCFFGNFPTHNCHSHNCICLINMSLLKLHCCLRPPCLLVLLLFQLFKKNDTLSSLFNPFAQKVMKSPHLVSITQRSVIRGHLPYQIGHHRFGWSRPPDYHHSTILSVNHYSNLSGPHFSHDPIINGKSVY